ncbi:hypothetical protein Tco_1333373 [Tanacetum coccineum]
MQCQNCFYKLQKKETYQLTLDALKLSLCYPAFHITDEVPKIYMHQFWNNIKMIRKTDAYDFKMDKKKCRVDIEEPGYSGNCEMLSIIRTDQMHQPWRTFAAIINRCIFGKSTGLDRLRESRAQILWAMYNQKNIDYVTLLWEDFMYQANNREISSTRKEHMPYLRFTKVINDHFISKDNTISMRNRINLHTVHDDTLLGTLKFVFKTKDCQKYRAVIPDGMINDYIKLSKAYKTYLDYATGKVPPKKARKSAKKALTVPTTGVVIRDTPDKSVSNNKAPASGSSEGADFESEVPDEQTDKPKDANEGIGEKPGVPDVSKYDSTDSEVES